MVPRKGEQPIGDSQPLWTTLGAKDRRHLVVHHFNIARIKNARNR